MKYNDSNYAWVLATAMDIYEDLKRDLEYRHYWGWSPKAAWIIAWGNARNLVNAYEAHANDGPYGRIS